MSVDLTLFSKDYQTARSRFCDTAQAADWDLQSHPRSGGREGELFTDFARLGPKHPRKLLVLTSGLHGVEGFLGSAIQLHLLKNMHLKQVVDSDSAILLGHALNPFGFARRRRFDETNVDLNRNFLIASEEYRGVHPYYRKIDTLLNPKKLPKWELPFQMQALSKVFLYGMQTLKQAVAEGQYEYPLGLFYGGDKPRSTVTFLEEKLLPEFHNAADVLHLDIHTGLGKRGTSDLLFDYELPDHQAIVLESIWEKSAAARNLKEHYTAKGGFSRWMRHHAPHSVSACWEFGTYGPVPVLAALRAENAAYHWGDRRSKAFQKAKGKLQETFCPKSHHWRRTVLENAQHYLASLLNHWLGDSQ